MAETETEDRTQGPSNRRRREARARGQVAHSPELTAAAGLLAASAALSAWGDGLATALVRVVREPLLGPAQVSAGAAGVVAHLRQLALGVAWPLGLVLGASALSALAAHQAQAGGVWAPGLLAPEPSRLWAVGQGGGLADRAWRGLWALARTVVVVAAAACVIRADWLAFPKLVGLDAPDLALAAGRSLRHLLLTLAVAALALGLVDYALRYRRLGAMLRLTPGEHREDLRSAEGDPALRARRLRLARSWRGDPADWLAGSSLLLTGPSGLTVVLAGGPPPRHVSVRSVVTGPTGVRLRRAAESAGLPTASAPGLALRLARRPPPTPELLAALAALWPPARAGGQAAPVVPSP
jgi:flagellar biosynthetic protein FlhB